MKDPLISIIIPVNNADLFLHRCLESFLNQNYDNWELICVDDGSTDDSLEILQNASSRDSRIKTFRQENQGVSAARNVGLKEAKGEIIGFCDADDEYAFGALRYVAETFRLQSCKMLVTGFERVSEEGKRTPASIKKSMWSSARAFQELMMTDNRITGAVWNKFFLADIIKEIKFDTRLTHCEDMHFVSQVLSKNQSMCVFVSAQMTYFYYNNPCSAVQSSDRLLDGKNNLRYLASFEAIEALYPRDIMMKCIANASKFRLLAENMHRFQQNPELVRKLARDAMRYILPYVIYAGHGGLRFRIKNVARIMKRAYF